MKHPPFPIVRGAHVYLCILTGQTQDLLCKALTRWPMPTYKYDTNTDNSDVEKLANSNPSS